jgi:hypothetical protein
MELSDTPTQRLKNMGFHLCGEWKLDNNRLKCDLVDCANAKNVLYAFVCEEQVLYIGKTVQSLRKRINGYQTPGPTQSTNIKGNKLIKESISDGKCIEIYALPDNGLLYYGGFHVNLAAGLEDSLVKTLKPSWNKAGI